MAELTFDIDDQKFNQLLGGVQRPSFDEFDALCARIRPVVRRNGRLYHIELNVATNTVFTMCPLSTRPVEKLVEAAKIHTLHAQGGYRLQFRPSADEVFAHLPAVLRESVIAFETIGPQTTDDIDRQLPAFDAGWHVAVTTLYARA